MIFQITYSNYASVLPLNGIEDYFQIEVEFKNETGELYVSSFHNSKLTIPWFLFSIGVALFLLLLLPLLFLRKKVQDIGILKDHILQMSGGDLNHPIASMGNDELGVLARELDQMRSTLYTNIQQEVESRRANQDLITAMSHDLRTPLTSILGNADSLISNFDALDEGMRKQIFSDIYEDAGWLIELVEKSACAYENRRWKCKTAVIRSGG